jgi:hypothetical protein
VQLRYVATPCKVFSSGEVNGSAQLRWLVTNVTGVSKGAVFPNQIITQCYHIMLIAEEEVLITTIQFTKVLISTWESSKPHRHIAQFMISLLKNCFFKTVSCGSAKNKINLDRCGKHSGQLIPLPSLLDRPSCRWTTGLQVLQECVPFHPSEASIEPSCL